VEKTLLRLLGPEAVMAWLPAGPKTNKTTATIAASSRAEAHER
jgi:hypothetical protein